MKRAALSSSVHKVTLAAMLGVELLTSITLLSCSSQLTRGKAAGMIESASQFQKPGIEWIFLGADFRRTDFIGFGNWQVVDALLASGHLRKQGNQIMLTEKGEAACSETPRDPQRENARSFVMAERELVEVTGITEATVQSTEAKEVQFTWRWSPTALGKELFTSNQRLASKYSAEDLRPGRAILRLYDDGWRLEQLQGL